MENFEEDTGPVRRIETLHHVRFSKMKPRFWFMEGRIFRSPDWKQNGKPYQINKEVKKKYIDSLPKQSYQGIIGFFRKMIDQHNERAEQLRARSHYIYEDKEPKELDRQLEHENMIEEGDD